MRTRTRGSPPWPTARRKAGYVCADCSRRSTETTCRRGRPCIFAIAAMLVDRIEDEPTICRSPSYALETSAKMRSHTPVLVQRRNRLAQVVAGP